MNIGIDIDDTICNSWENVINEICTDFNINYDESLKSNKVYNQAIGLNEEEYLKYAKEKFPKLLYNPTLKDNVKEVIDILKQKNKIIFITARSNQCYEDAYQFTKNYLDRNKIYYDKIIVNGQEKGKICKQEKINIFIDDSIDNCRNVSKYKIKIILFETNYNKNCNEFIKVNNWEKILEIVKEVQNEG